MATKSLRDQLVGAWELVEYSAYLPNNKSDTVHPMGKDAQGIIMYTPDGYMSAQLQRMGVPQMGFAKNDSDWAAIGKHYIAYTGRFFLDEQGDEHGPLLVHEMRTSNLPRLIGDRQRRLCRIEDESDGRYLYLSVADAVSTDSGSGPSKDERVPLVRWRRLGENFDKREPAK